MRRLIDANACLHDMCKRCNIENEGCPCEPADCFIYNVLENSPTVDAVVLPCKIGEKVFCILHGKNEIVEDVVEDYDIWSIKAGIKLRLSLLNHNDYVVGEFGKTVFLTREEAESALAKMVGDGNG